MKGNNRQFTGVRGVFVAFLLVVLLSACSKRGEKTMSKEVGGLRFTVAYQPFVGNTEGNRNEIEYFKVQLGNTDGRDIVQYLSETSGLTREEVLYYFSYRLKDDIFLDRGGKKEGNVLYHFERSFDLKSGRVFNIGFVPAESTGEDMTLLIDSELLDVGPVKLKFSK